jgi:hypothetical protein
MPAILRADSLDLSGKSTSRSNMGDRSWSKVQEFWKSTLVTVAAGENLVWVSPEFV